ncbi:hypothetical protein [Micromonospora inyonensis]|uniref:Uncharacterized protein n=1 Tax=Micromonospora inyonensis TaxID=47866 RepID=A0A1C6RKM0_9ACTN|nr:hypothetical protein [Micromonospora inyonensis]SCL17715.1 hypothetical protein GA0074694_2106 [Micromonospora inyonensis]
MTLHPPAPPEATHSSHTAQRSGAAVHAANVGRDSTAQPTTAPTTGNGIPIKPGRQAAPPSRGTTGPLTRDALDADLANAVHRTARTRQAFYVLVLLVALVGQVTGAVQTLGIPVIVAIPAVAALELGGVVVMANADVRRRLGERAIASRLLSAAIAAAAVTFNWVVHPDHLVGGFYAGMSALGYLVWLMHAGNQRRDRLRATGDLPPTPPAYELFAHWMRHPVITSRARAIAKAEGLDLYESLETARATIARERRDAAIAAVLHRKIRAAVDTTTADIAVQVYDLNEIAARLAATADYHALTTLLATDLAPERILTAHSVDRRRRWLRREDRPAASSTTDPTPPPSCAHSQPAADTPGAGRQESNPEPKRNEPTPNDEYAAQSYGPVPPPAVPPTDEPANTGWTGRGEGDAGVAGNNVQDETNDDQGAASEAVNEDGGSSEVPKGTAEAVAYWLRREPNMEPELLAAKIGKSLRSVYRYLPADYPRRPGVPRDRTPRRPSHARRLSQSE